MAGTILKDNPLHPSHPAYKKAHEETAALIARDEERANKKTPSDSLKTDGPTVAEFVKAGYDPKGYPPTGYASKSTEAEIAAAIKAFKPKE